MRRLWLCFAFEAFKGSQAVWFITLLALRRPLNDIQVIVCTYSHERQFYHWCFRCGFWKYFSCWMTAILNIKYQTVMSLRHIFLVSIKGIIYKFGILLKSVQFHKWVLGFRNTTQFLTQCNTQPGVIFDSVKVRETIYWKTYSCTYFTLDTLFFVILSFILLYYKYK